MSHTALHSLEHEPDDRRCWEWSPEEIRRIGHQVVDLIAEHLDSMRDELVFQVFPEALASARGAI